MSGAWRRGLPSAPLRRPPTCVDRAGPPGQRVRPSRGPMPGPRGVPTSMSDRLTRVPTTAAGTTPAPRAAGLRVAGPTVARRTTPGPRAASGRTGATTGTTATAAVTSATTATTAATGTATTRRAAGGAAGAAGSAIAGAAGAKAAATAP